MILYHAITAYHILKCAVHKLRNHPDEQAVLLVHNYLLRKFSGLFNNTIFSSVYFFTWERFKGNKEGIFIEIDRQLKTALKNKNINDLSEINVCSAAYFFGSWLVEHKTTFQWFEEADGRLSQPEPIMEDDARIAPFRYELAVESGLYTGNNPCVLKKYVKMSAQLPGFSDPLAVNFDVIEEMNQLSQKDKSLLLDFFDVPRDLSFQPNSVLMLTAHFCNIRIMTYEEHALCYQLTSDYYLEGYKLYYKWHPSDLMPYQSFMENVTMVSAHFPSELLTLVQEEPFEVGASISSTGIYNISSIYKRVLIFNQEYLKTFWHNHQYYFCVKFIEQFPTYAVCAISVNQIQLENMIEFGGVLEERQVEYYDSLSSAAFAERAAVYLIGSHSTYSDEDLCLFYNSIKSEDIIVFLNEGGTYPCYSIMRKAPFIAKELQLSAIDQTEFRGMRCNEQIIIFTKDLTAWRKVEEMKFVKRLLHTGAELDVLSTTDKDTQIAALKGMLKATEQQLEKYMEENQKLKQELESRS